MTESIGNKEIQRFVDFVGGPKKAAAIMDCTPNMVNKLERGVREPRFKYIKAMYLTKKFKLNFARLHGLSK